MPGRSSGSARSLMFAACRMTFSRERSLPHCFSTWTSPCATVYGYTVAQGLVHVLKQCGKDLSRENVMRQAANIKDLALPLLLPGIKVNTSPTDFYPIEQEQLAKFDGQRWALFGEIYDAGKK